jgi:ribosomal protein S18 acetylase RimI-like enzyme
MPLPVLPHRADTPNADLVRLFQKTGSMWASHLAEPEQLDAATAYANPSLPKVWDANQVRDVAVPQGLSPSQAIQEIESHFASQNSRCVAWVMNPSAPTDQTRPITEHLLAAGYHPRINDIFYLRRTPQRAIPQVQDLKIIPARASYRHALALAHENAAECYPDVAEQLAQAWESHLDDPHFDALIALKGDQAVASVGVLAVGELGLIEGLYVSKPHRRQGLARTMMSRALEIAARSLFKHVFLSTLPDNHAAIALYQTLGFEKIGQFTRYLAPAT